MLFRITDEQGKTQQSPIHVNRMKKITDRATFDDVEEIEEAESMEENEGNEDN